MDRDGKQFDIEMFFRALADRTRLMLINLMSIGEVCVCFFVEILGTNQPKISRHLAYLRRAGIVAARRDGKWMHYRLGPPPPPAGGGILGEAPHAVGKDKRVKGAREGLKLGGCRPPNLCSSAPGPPPLPLPNSAEHT